MGCAERAQVSLCGVCVWSYHKGIRADLAKEVKRWHCDILSRDYLIFFPPPFITGTTSTSLFPSFGCLAGIENGMSWEIRKVIWNKLCAIKNVLFNHCLSLLCSGLLLIESNILFKINKCTDLIIICTVLCDVILPLMDRWDFKMKFFKCPSRLCFSKWNYFYNLGYNLYFLIRLWHLFLDNLLLLLYLCLALGVKIKKSWQFTNLWCLSLYFCVFGKLASVDVLAKHLYHRL